MVHAKITAMYVRKGYQIPRTQRIIQHARWFRRSLLDVVRGAASWAELPEILRTAFSLSAVAGSVAPLSTGGPAIQAEQKFLHILGTLTLTGNYPGAPGDTLDITQIVLPPGWTLPVLGPLIVGWAASIKATGPSGFSYTILPGATLQTNKLDVQQGGGAASPNGEISTAAYPAGVLTDTVQFEMLLGIAG